MSWMDKTEKIFFESEKQAKTKAEQECAAELERLRKFHPLVEEEFKAAAARDQAARLSGVTSSATAQGYAWRLQRQHAVVRSKGIEA